MGNNADSESMPDVFGAIFPGIKQIHNNVYKELLCCKKVKKETQMHTLQCNFGEYLSYGHDSNYSWEMFSFDDSALQKFAIGFNTISLENNEFDKNRIISTLQKSWMDFGINQISYLGIISNVAYLKKENWEMILSLHFYYERNISDPQNIDTQYFKIVYTKTSLSNYMEKIRLTTCLT